MFKSLLTLLITNIADDPVLSAIVAVMLMACWAVINYGRKGDVDKDD